MQRFVPETVMLKDLPSPIAAYVDANARLDPGGMLAPFAPATLEIA